MASIVAHVVEGLQAQLFEDDRLLIHERDYKQAVWEEIDWVSNTTPLLWKRLHRLTPSYRSPQELFSLTFRCCLRAHAYQTMRIWRSLGKGLWPLCKGDTEANARALYGAPRPAHDDVVKAWALVNNGEINTVKSGLALLRNTSFTSNNIEQGHRSASVTHQYHPFLGAKHLVERSTLHGSLPLFRDLAPASRTSRLKARMVALGRKKPLRVSGQNVYVGRVAEIAKRKSLQSGP